MAEELERYLTGRPSHIQAWLDWEAQHAHEVLPHLPGTLHPTQG
jgi:hypothetical protein